MATADSWDEGFGVDDIDLGSEDIEDIDWAELAHFAQSISDCCTRG